MRKGVSTLCCARQRLHPGVLDQLASGGAEEIEIFGSRGHFDFYDRQHVREIAAWFEEQGKQLHSVHAPMYFDKEIERAGQTPVNVVAFEKKQRIEAMDELKRLLEVAEHLPFRYLVQHLGDRNESFSPRKFDDAMTAVEHLRAFAKPLGVTILLENLPNEIASPENLVKLIDTAHFRDVGVCFDSGHAHMCGGVQPAFEMLAPYVRSTHIHDNDSTKDAHLWPGDGTIDWNRMRELLASAPAAPPYLLELEQDVLGERSRLRSAFDELSRFGALKA